MVTKSKDSDVQGPPIEAIMTKEEMLSLYDVMHVGLPEILDSWLAQNKDLYLGAKYFITNSKAMPQEIIDDDTSIIVKATTPAQLETLSTAREESETKEEFMEKISTTLPYTSLKDALLFSQNIVNQYEHLQKFLTTTLVTFGRKVAVIVED